MTQAGFTIAGSAHPICPVMLGDARLASLMADDMLKLGETAVEIWRRGPKTAHLHSPFMQLNYTALAPLTRLLPPQECTWLDSLTQSYQRAKPESAFRFQQRTQTRTSTTVLTLSSRRAESMESSPEQDKWTRINRITKEPWTACPCISCCLLLKTYEWFWWIY